MASMSNVIGAQLESARADADQLRKFANDIEDKMTSYVDDMKNKMATELQTEFAQNEFSRDLDKVKEMHVQEIENIINANAQNINTAADEVEAYSTNSDYQSIN